MKDFIFTLYKSWIYIIKPAIFRLFNLGLKYSRRSARVFGSENNFNNTENLLIIKAHNFS